MNQENKIQEETIKQLQETIDFNVSQNIRLIRANYEYHKMLYDIAVKLVNVHQLVSGWKGTTPKEEWSDFDQLQLDNLFEIQQIILAKIGFECADCINSRDEFDPFYICPNCRNK